LSYPPAREWGIFYPQMLDLGAGIFALISDVLVYEI
jgi:hypothetical protein